MTLFTINDKFSDLLGPPVVEPVIETVKVPTGVLALVLIVNVTGTGTPETGFTEVAGWKLHVAPAGSPLHESATAALNAPAAVTWKPTGPEEFPGATVTLLGASAVIAKSTTCTVSAKLRINVLGSVPTPCALKK